MEPVPGWDAALAEAHASLAAGGVPIGAALVDRNGTVVARGHNERHQRGGLAYHAEIVCLHNAGLLPLAALAETTLVTTTIPCWMCAGAVVQHGIPRVVAGIASHDGIRVPSHDFLESRGVEVVDLGRTDQIQLMTDYIAAHPDDWFEDLGAAVDGLDLSEILDEGA
jgi:creatinine deaminase